MKHAFSISFRAGRGLVYACDINRNDFVTMFLIVVVVAPEARPPHCMRNDLEDMRKLDKIPAAFDSVEKLLTENELPELPVGVLSRQEMAKESYPETRYT